MERELPHTEPNCYDGEMSAPSKMQTAEAAIWDRLIPPGDSIPPEVAEWILALAFSEYDRDRMNDLAVKAREGRLSKEENAEMEVFERVGDMLAVLRAKSLPAKRHRHKPRSA